MAVKSCQEARVGAAAVVLEVWATITLIKSKTLRLFQFGENTSEPSPISSENVQ